MGSNPPVIHADLEPGIITLELLKESIIQQGPKGEEGRLFVLDGIKLEETEEIRLDFLNILKIDCLWMMVKLVKLQLGTNQIEKIANLEMLVNLKELDLSFNNIPKIENIEKLVNLEILCLFQNRVAELENLETLTKLNVLSIGNNQIDSWDSVIYLRQFSKLNSLNMSGNPCCDIPNFTEYVFAYLPKIVYYEYKLISTEERDAACLMFQKPLRLLDEEDAKKNAIKEAEEKEIAEAEFYSEAFIEYLNKDQLFKSLFAKDDFGQALLLVGKDAMECYEEYETQFNILTQKIFTLGQEQHELRQGELQQFYQCINTAKEKVQKDSQKWMENFLETKLHIFAEIRKFLATMEDAADEDLGDAVEKMARLSDEFQELDATTWKSLMGMELTLFEQVEELTGNFGRNLTDVVNVFVEAAQGLFVQCRDLEVVFNNQLSECCNRFMTHLILEADMTVPPELKSIMADKEALSNAISTSHDVHMQLIDSREDTLVTRVREWAMDLCEDLHWSEIKRDRAAVLEINHFLDIQREELDDIQSAPIASAAT